MVYERPALTESLPSRITASFISIGNFRICNSKDLLHGHIDICGWDVFADSCNLHRQLEFGFRLCVYFYWNGTHR